MFGSILKINSDSDDDDFTQITRGISSFCNKRWLKSPREEHVSHPCPFWPWFFIIAFWMGHTRYHQKKDPMGLHSWQPLDFDHPPASMRKFCGLWKVSRDTKVVASKTSGTQSKIHYRLPPRAFDTVFSNVCSRNTDDIVIVMYSVVTHLILKKTLLPSGQSHVSYEKYPYPITLYWLVNR